MFKKVHSFRSKLKPKTKKKNEATKSDNSDSSSFREETKGTEGTDGERRIYEEKLRAMRVELDNKYNEQLEGMKKREASNALRVNTKLAWVTKQRDEMESKLRVMERKYRNLKKKLAALESSSSISGYETVTNENGATDENLGTEFPFHGNETTVKSSEKSRNATEMVHDIQFLKTWCKDTNVVLNDLTQGMTHTKDAIMKMDQNLQKLLVVSENGGMALDENEEEKLQTSREGLNVDLLDDADSTTEVPLGNENCDTRETAVKYPNGNDTGLLVGANEDHGLIQESTESFSNDFPSPHDSDNQENLNEAMHPPLELNESSTVDLTSVAEDGQVSQCDVEGHSVSEGTVVDMHELAAEVTRQLEVPLMYFLNRYQQLSQGITYEEWQKNCDLKDGCRIMSPKNRSHSPHVQEYTCTQVYATTKVNPSENRVESFIYPNKVPTKSEKAGNDEKTQFHDECNHAQRCAKTWSVQCSGCLNSGSNSPYRKRAFRTIKSHVIDHDEHSCSDHVLRHIVKSSAMIANLRDLKPCEEWED